MSLKDIKNKIRSVDKTYKVTKAMEAVSAIKMRKSQERALLARPYAVSALTILSRVSESMDAAQHPLTQAREGKRIGCLVITSDKGFAGSLNMSVIKATLKVIADFDKKDVTLFCIGNKGKNYFEKRGFTIAKHFTNIGDKVSSTDMLEVTNALSDLFLENSDSDNNIDRAFSIYTNFISTVQQETVVRQVLPISLEEVTKIITGIVPKKGKHAEVVPVTQNKLIYEIEPDPEEVLNQLLPFLLNIELYHSLLESKASEHSARMVAMKNASDKAEEMSEDLTREFNRARQAMITREVSEIIGGMEVMK